MDRARQIMGKRASVACIAVPQRQISPVGARLCRNSTPFSKSICRALDEASPTQATANHRQKSIRCLHGRAPTPNFSGRGAAVQEFNVISRSICRALNGSGTANHRQKSIRCLHRRAPTPGKVGPRQQGISQRNSGGDELPLQNISNFFAHKSTVSSSSSEWMMLSGGFCAACASGSPRLLSQMARMPTERAPMMSCR